MATITNKHLALLVVAALGIVIASAAVQLDRLDSYGFTGFAPYGNVSLTINDSLNIEVDDNNLDIDFGGCTPAASAFTVDSNVSTANGNCTGQASTGLDNLTVRNIGNVGANVNVTAECTIQQFLPEVAGNDNDFAVFVKGCTPGAGLAAYTTLETSALSVCPDMDPGTNFTMWARVTIDSDTNSTQLNPCDDGANELTFSAVQA